MNYHMIHKSQNIIKKITCTRDRNYFFNCVQSFIVIYTYLVYLSYILSFIIYVSIFKYDIVKNIQWCHSYISCEFIKINKSVFTNKNKIKFPCPVSLTKNITKINI